MALSLVSYPVEGVCAKFKSNVKGVYLINRYIKDAAGVTQFEVCGTQHLWWCAREMCNSRNFPSVVCRLEVWLWLWLWLSLWAYLMKWFATNRLRVATMTYRYWRTRFIVQFPGSHRSIGFVWFGSSCARGYRTDCSKSSLQVNNFKVLSFLTHLYVFKIIKF